MHGLLQTQSAQPRKGTDCGACSLQVEAGTGEPAGLTLVRSTDDSEEEDCDYAALSNLPTVWLRHKQP